MERLNTLEKLENSGLSWKDQYAIIQREIQFAQTSGNVVKLLDFVSWKISGSKRHDGEGWLNVWKDTRARIFVAAANLRMRGVEGFFINKGRLATRKRIYEDHYILLAKPDESEELRHYKFRIERISTVLPEDGQRVLIEPYDDFDVSLYDTRRRKPKLRRSRNV